MDDLGKTHQEAYERTRRLQKQRCADLIREARDLESRAVACRAQARVVARSWGIELDKLPEGE